ncbi:MAG: hypothetical protein ACJ785_08775 [Gemmatimonadaceae bacterium]
MAIRSYSDVAGSSAPINRASSATATISGRPAIWCKAKAINQRLMIDAAPRRFFSPPYVGPSGWIGVWVDGDCDWNELLDLLRDGYRMTAPKKLLARLEEK